MHTVENELNICLKMGKWENLKFEAETNFKAVMICGDAFSIGSYHIFKNNINDLFVGIINLHCFPKIAAYL